jgi:hypothetical protein
MCPEPDPRLTPEVRATADRASSPTEALKLKDRRKVARVAADSQHASESALRIRAALRAARSDEQHGQPAEALKPPGTWIVKALPRPPLVAVMLQEPPSDELLANDSPGG